MKENQTNMQYYEDEIDLKELFMALWKQKKIIISLTLLIAIIAGIVSFFVMSPKYEANLNMIVHMPEIYDTRYGEYKLPISTNEQYIDLFTSNDVLLNTIRDMEYSPNEVSIEKLRSRISIGKSEAKSGSVQNSFKVTVTANNPDESLKLAETLYKNYVEFLDVMTKERAINYFYNDFNVKLKSADIELKSKYEILKANEKLLAQTPQTINQKVAMDEIQGAAKDYVVLENIINPNYTKVETDVIVTKQAINDLEIVINEYINYVAALEIEKQAISEYYESGQAGGIKSDFLSIVETSIYLPSKPVAPTVKSGPNNTMNVLIGAILGGMIGVGAALIKEYWFEKA